MRKQLVGICTIVILVFNIYGCAKTDINAPMADVTEQDMFTYIIDDNSAVITGLQAEYANFLQENTSIDKKIKIPDTLGGYSVVEIGDHAFENIKLKSVHIPESGEVIGNSAFRNTDIENVNISQCHNLKEVKANAFENCNLHDQDYSTWFMEKIGARAFAGNRKLFYGELGGTYGDWDDDMWCSFEKTPDAPNYGFEDWQWPGCSKWCHINVFTNHATASSELNSASGRYCADNVV